MRCTQLLKELSGLISNLPKAENFQLKAEKAIEHSEQKLGQNTPGPESNLTEIYQGLQRLVFEFKEAKKELFRQKAFFDQLFDNSPQAIAIMSPAGSVINFNKSFSKLFGFELEKHIGVYWQKLLVPEEFREESKSLLSSVQRGDTVHKETYRLNSNKVKIPVSLISYPIKIDNKIEGIFCEYIDISERKLFEKQLHEQAFYDTLTRIPNRVLLMERLEQALKKRCRDASSVYAVLVVDIDRFKTIIDSYGHIYGDRLLIKITNRFKACLRSTDTLARLGGDEFAVLLEGFDTVNEVISITRRLNRVCNVPITLEDKKIHISASIGIVLDTGLYLNPEEVLRDAEIAMYKAKEQDGNCFRLFNKAMHDMAVESLEIENELRHAIQASELLLHFQPIMSGDGTRLKGFEALARWNHPQKGLIYPDRFIPVAEESGLIIPLGRYIIEQAIMQIKEWENYFSKHSLSINVNVSVKQVLRNDFGQFVLSLIDKYDIQPKFLQLEVTETVLMKSTEAAIQQLNLIRNSGVRVVIDDFGTGYSSLSYLRKFPIDTLKIDKSFISELGKTEEDNEIVKTIITLGKNLRLTVVAEGVEEKGQLEYLKKLSCDHVQGYLLSKPVGKDEAQELLRKIS